MYNAENLIQVFQNYAGTTVFLILFPICLFYCYLTGKQEDKKRFLLIISLSILLIFNDISKALIETLITGTYYRFLWAVPILLLTAYMITRILTERKKGAEIVVILIITSAMLFYNSGTFPSIASLPDNKYAVSDDVIQVCDIIEQDKDKDRPIVIFDLEMQLSARTYNASFIWGISRNAYMNCNDLDDYESAGKYRNQKIMIQAVNYGVQGEGDVLAEALLEKNVDYLVTFTAFEMDEYFEEIGYVLVGRSDSRSVYGKCLLPSQE